VLLEEAPAAAYTGGVAGYPATKPAAGKKLNKNRAAVVKYVGYLTTKHNNILRRSGGTKVYDYVYSLNGFAAVLSKAQVAKLRATKGVVSVQQDHFSQPATDSSPTFLGLNEPGGIWSQLGGQGSAGEDVIIGVVDTGLWPEHPSFADTNYGPAPAGWNGTCQSGEQWTQTNCSDKVIGARYFVKGFGHSKHAIKGDFVSPRDAEGHGSHTAGTAGGNANVTATILGRNMGTISGMAPRARIAVYKACWPGGCAVSDLTAAIDTAVADGVDVINYSIGDGDPDFLDADDVSFLFARQANVFVAASAGNDGPNASTTDHGGPWLTTVAASTQDRTWQGTVTLGNGATYTGVAVRPDGLGSTPIVDGEKAGTNSTGCLTGLDPAKVTGKIVICEGSFSRAARSRAVKNAGGVGMVLYTATQNDTLMSDTHHVPTVHVQNADGMAIKAYAATAGATASITSGVKAFGNGNKMAAFSSRGPLLPSARSTGDLLKPDITAPGVQILAANSPVETNAVAGQLFQSIGGTSMSSPHIAGIGALLRDRHPSWTPAEMQSAIMTSARQNVTKQDGTTPADPFDFGAGHVVPNGAANPGLVYPVAFDDYRAFLKSQGLCNLCFGTTPAPVVAPTDLNVPSVTIRALTGTKTVTRRVKNVGSAGTYTASVAAPAGVNVTVTPSTLTLGAGATDEYEIEFTANSAALFDEYSFGSLTWTNGSNNVRIPLVVRPVAITAPAEIVGTGVSGSEEYTVTLGYNGNFEVAPQGLVPATTEERTVVDDPTNNFDTDNPDDNQGIQVHEIAVNAGTTLARFSTFDDFTDGEDDLDLYLYDPDGELVGQSAGATAAERIELSNPAEGDYKLYVHGWETDGADAVYTLFNWLVDSTDEGNMTVTSSTSTATTGGTADITVNWSGLTAGTKYLGRVSYSDGVDEIGGTIVTIN
jgi:subtilisin family serine protease